jgi:oligopeptide transport system permease protein
MLRFIFRRILETIPVLFIIITATFFLNRFMPGGPFDSERATTPEIRRNLEVYYGYDKPLYVQYLTYMERLLLHGDMGVSMKYLNRTINEIISDKLPASLELGGLSLLVALGLGLTLGTIAALRPNTFVDYFASGFSMIGICLPTFVLGPLLVLFFAINLRWFDASGWYNPIDRVLPSLTLGSYYGAYIARLTRAGMLEVLNQDYIRTARAKGASTARIVFRHALRGGILPVVSFLGPAVAGILTGSFVIETIFQIPGLGREFVNSVFNRDGSLICGTVLLYATFLILLNMAVDIAQAWLNPKVKLE